LSAGSNAESGASKESARSLADAFHRPISWRRASVISFASSSVKLPARPRRLRLCSKLDLERKRLCSVRPLHAGRMWRAATGRLADRVSLGSIKLRIRIKETASEETVSNQLKIQAIAG
jgi:hypothetical protein